MPDLGAILYPIVWLMELVLAAYICVLGSVGISILLLSATFSVLLFPLQLAGQKIERRVTQRTQAVNDEVRLAKAAGLRGEELFNATDTIYLRHGYHPIQAMMSGAGFLTSLPILVSSIYLFQGSPLVEGRGFLFIPDLGAPDSLLLIGTVAVNVLPLLMFFVTLVDTKLRFTDDKSSQRKFLILSTALLVLVYSMPSGLVIYWVGNNLSAMALAAVARGRRTEL